MHCRNMDNFIGGERWSCASNIQHMVFNEIENFFSNTLGQEACTKMADHCWWDDRKLNQQKTLYARELIEPRFED